jgi:hypothetical protein
MGFRDRGRIQHGRVVIATEIAGEHDLSSSPIEFDNCRSKKCPAR